MIRYQDSASRVGADRQRPDRGAMQIDDAACERTRPPVGRRQRRIHYDYVSLQTCE